MTPFHVMCSSFCPLIYMKRPDWCYLGFVFQYTQKFYFVFYFLYLYIIVRFIRNFILFKGFLVR